MTLHCSTTRTLEGCPPSFPSTPTLAWLGPQLRLWGFGEAERIVPGSGSDRFARVEQGWEQFLQTTEIDDPAPQMGTGPIGFGSFSFSARAGGSLFIIPKIVLGNRGADWWITGVDCDPDPSSLESTPSSPAERDRPRYAGASIPDQHWLEAVAEAISIIEQGAIEKVVLARDQAVWSKTPFDIGRLLARLHQQFPDCFTFIVDGLLGASPELLIRRFGTRVESVCLAGSTARGIDRISDQERGQALLNSDKDLREHEPVVKAVNQALSAYCDHLSMPPQPELLGLSNIYHLATHISGYLNRDYSSLELVSRLHPTPAVGGAPTKPALMLIEQLEGMDRGRYAAPVGWMDRDGNGEWAIALRCAEISGARARLFAGAGIVAGSLPEQELEETRLKFEAMMGALTPSSSLT